MASRGFKVELSMDGRDVAKLVRNLARIDRKLAKKTLRRAVTLAGRLVRDAAKDKVRIRSGLLRKSIGVRVRSYTKNNTIVAVVGPRRNFRKDFEGRKIDAVKYAHLVEFGTKHSRPFPFIRPAWDENKAKAYEIIASTLIDALRDVRSR